MPTYFSARFSPAQKVAILRAHDEGRTVPEIIRMAEKGRLPGTDAFKVPAMYFYALIRKAERS